ncbi:MAG: hypothetical protein IIB05_11755, partial [Bacteroidetes bacterium]|nr:hypothetical protein [Bacteroidota bacterium]
MINILIITYYWPPAGGPGVQRMLKFVKYLPEFGIKPHILTVKNGDFPAIDESLADEIPGGLIVKKIKGWEPYGLFRFLTGRKKDEKIPVGILVQDNLSTFNKIFSWIRLNLFIPDGRLFLVIPFIRTARKMIRDYSNRIMTIKKNIDLVHGSKLSEYTVNSFVRHDAEKAGVKFGLLRMSDVFTTYHKRVVEEGENPYYGVKRNLDLDVSTLRAWDVTLGNMKPPMVFIGMKGSTNASMIFANVTDEHIESATNYQAYFKKEVDSGNFGDDETIRKELLTNLMISAQQLSNDGSKNAMAQIISRHEFMKFARGRRYLVRDMNVQNHYRRINLDFSEGVVAIGSGPSHIRIYNPIYATLVTKEGKRIALTEVIDGEVRYKFDGLIFTSKDILKVTDESVGRIAEENANESDEAKTVIRDLSEDGSDYVVIKGMEMVPEEGIQILDDNDVVIMRETNGNMVDANGEKITHLVSSFLENKGEVKDSDGIFKLDNRHYTDIIEIPETSRRIIKTQLQHSKDSATFPSSWLDVLTAPEF